MGPSTVRTTHCMTEREAEEILRTCPGEHPGLSLLMEAAERRIRYREAKGAIGIRMPRPLVKVKRRSSGSAEDAVHSVPAAGAPGGNAGNAGACGADGEVVGEGDGGGSRSKNKNSGGGGGESDKDGMRVVNGTRAATAVREFEAARAEVTAQRLDFDNPVQDLVTEMMILAGELVGKFGAEHGVPLPFRGQNPPRLPSDEELAAGAHDVRSFVYSFTHSFMHSFIR